MNKLRVLMMVVPLIALPLWAQEEGEQKSREAVQEESEQKTREMVKEEGSRETKYGGRTDEEGKLLRAIRLPEAAEEARQEGVPEEDVKKVLEAARSNDLPAGETETIMVEETKAVKEKGQIDNFGSFVESKLEEGLRGRELAEAIRAEHAARGKGKGHGKTKKHGAGRAAELDDDEADGKRGKHGKKKDKGKYDDRMSDEKERLEEEVEKEEEEIREMGKTEKKKWNKGKKKGKEELPPEKESK